MHALIDIELTWKEKSKETDEIKHSYKCFVVVLCD